MDTFKREREANSKKTQNNEPEMDFSFFAEFSKLNISPIRKGESKDEFNNFKSKNYTFEF